MNLGPNIEPRGPRHVLWEGTEYLFFGGNDYHRLAFHPEVVEAACEAAAKWGLNLSGSRVTSANHPLYEALEIALARYLDAEAAVVFSAGYMSNSVLLQAIGDRYTHLLIDANAHASLVEAARTVSLPAIAYDHLSPESFAQALGNLPAGAAPLAMTDGVFASTGEVAPLGQFKKFGVDILVDDAHAMGTLGENGKGSWSECGLGRQGVFQTGTLSKGLGGFGGVIAADQDTIERIKTRSSAFIGSTPMPVPLAAAALKSIEILEREPHRVQLLRSRSVTVKRELVSMGFALAESPSPICSVTFLDGSKNRRLYEDLKQALIFPNFVDYPGGPPGGHFRFTLSSAHLDEDIERLLAVVRQVAEEFR